MMMIMTKIRRRVCAVVLLLVLFGILSLGGGYYRFLTGWNNNNSFFQGYLVVIKDNNNNNNVTSTTFSTSTTAKTNATTSTFTNDDDTIDDDDDNLIVVCLVGEMGRTCNKMLQLANTIYHVNHKYNKNSDDGDNATHTTTKKSKAVVGLNTSDWINFYNEWFDPRPDVLLLSVDDDKNNNDKSARFSHSKKCTTTVSAKEMHYRQSPHVVNRELINLIPKVSIRQEARRIVQNEILSSSAQSSSSNQNSKPYWVSVHRRKLEGQCKKRIHKNLTSCTYLMEYAGTSSSSVDKPIDFNNPLAHVHYKHQVSHPILDAKFICDIQYDNVTNDVAYQQLVTKQREEQRENSQKQSSALSSSVPIILFTDHQKPIYDDTFLPNIDKHPFNVQLYMMALSTIHYGNPSSSVDHVVAHWRLGNNMIPSNCWKSSHFV